MAGDSSSSFPVTGGGRTVATAMETPHVLSPHQHKTAMQMDSSSQQ
jgi:hypothetical protein